MPSSWLDLYPLISLTPDAFGGVQLETIVAHILL